MLVFSHCYHGSVDETFVTLDGAPAAVAGGQRRARGRSRRMTTRVCEFNDLDAVERLLADGQVACVLAEPALTNIGIVLPEPGFHDGAARGLRAHGDAADHRRDAHDQRRAGRLHRARGDCAPTW